MDYRKRFLVFERAAWLRELKMLKAFTYRLLVQVQSSQQFLKAITSQQQLSFCVMNWEAVIAQFGVEETEGRHDSLFQTRRNSCKMEGTSCSPASRTNGLKLQERSIKLCNSAMWGTDCLGRLQSLHNFSRDQFRLLSLRREAGTASLILRPEERPHSVLMSQPAKGFRQLTRAVMVNSRHCGAFKCHLHSCFLLQSLTNPKEWFFIFQPFLRE